MKFLDLLITICILMVYTSLVHAQQPYIGDPKAACDSNSNTAIYLAYSCNGRSVSCKTNLTYRSQFPYNTLSAIASLLSVDANDIAQANPNYNVDTVEWNELVYVPITCSCKQGSQYYRKFTSRIVGPNDSYFTMANNTYQGLTTCQAIQLKNNLNTSNLIVGINITIPLRCACPTNNQHSSGINSLFSYVVGEGDTIASVSTQLNVDSESIREANQLLENSTIYPFTALLIPVTNEKSTTTLSKLAIGGIVAGAVAALLGLGGFIKLVMRGNRFNCFNSTTNVFNYHWQKTDKRPSSQQPRKIRRGS